MLSKSQWVLIISLFGWALVVYKLMAMRSSNRAADEPAVTKESMVSKIKLPAAHVQSATPPELATNKRLPPKAQESREASKPATTSPSTAKLERLPETTSKWPKSAQKSSSRTVEDFKVDKMPFVEFAALPHASLLPISPLPPHTNSYINTCSDEVSARMDRPIDGESLNWCKWALSSQGGGVKVGKSYGSLNGPDREKYERLNCNAVAKDIRPSCSLTWGDQHINTWGTGKAAPRCQASDSSKTPYLSKVDCRTSINDAMFCVFENIAMRTSAAHDVPRGAGGHSRSWDRDFFSLHCPKEDLGYYEFFQGIIENPEKKQCDYVIDTPVIIYGHDNLKNLGHSLSDFMNVWAMLWLSGLGGRENSVTFINTDAIRMGHNYFDSLTPFTVHYENAFRELLKFSDFPKDANVCIKKLLFMPRPLILFTWDGWWQDMPCTVGGGRGSEEWGGGPSSLFQRWNLRVRQAAGLLGEAQTGWKAQYGKNNVTMQGWGRETVQSLAQVPGLQGIGFDVAAKDTGESLILLIERRASSATPQQQSRVWKNLPDCHAALEKAVAHGGWGNKIRVVRIDLSTLPFHLQLQLIHRSSMVVGVHGAGIPASMHMRIGGGEGSTLYKDWGPCCGVVEIFPRGEFFPIRGYGNMARRMGLTYRRLDLDNSHNGRGGVNIPSDSLVATVKEIWEVMKSEDFKKGDRGGKSCVLKEVVEDMFFEKISLARGVN